MATSKCPKCESSRFELELRDVKNCRYRLNFVQCVSCGTVVGAMEYSNTGALIDGLAQQLKELKVVADQTGHRVRTIESVLARR